MSPSLTVRHVVISLAKLVVVYIGILSSRSVVMSHFIRRRAEMVVPEDEDVEEGWSHQRLGTACSPG
jgi:hypothetical protein